MAIKLSDHFTYSKLLRFTLPSITMMIFTSVYSVVDGLFVSNLIGENALSAVNIMFPVSMIIGAVGFMLGSGGSAIVARTMGEGKQELANRYFSMIILCVLGLGTALSALSLLFVEPLARLVGASDLLIDDCLAYGAVIFGGSVVFMLQMSFQTFFVTAELPKIGLFFSLISGVTNITLDYLFMGPLNMGIAGAAWGTVLSYAVGGILPLFFFLKPPMGTLRLCSTKLYWRELKNACINGSSELMSNLSASLISILYNLQLMRMVGELGVAAYSVMMYVDFAFAAVFLGFSMGSGPIISFHYGAGNEEELKSIFRKSISVISIASVFMVAMAQLLGRPLAMAYVGYNPELLEMTVHGFRIFAFSYLFCGFGVYGSGFFTALCNGAISALISFLRLFLFRGGMVLLLPLFFKLDGIWLAVTVADALGALVSVLLIWKYRKRYHYL
ncbi:MAG: MATE family efflux transporter [Lawsonibacter sp.]|jgi:putative MATE family efflux protein|nr:MATE family efflux transporter [Lawsonibacter sp.]